MQISVHSLACRRGGRVLFRALEWHAGPGDLVAVRGPNGAGKTSLLRLIAGLGLPEEGEVRWDGRSIGEDRAGFNASLAWLGHADGVKGDLTPRENLDFHRALQPEPGARVEQALERFGLGAVADLPTRTLSAGQRRRVALARLEVSRAVLWILDEPMTALDVEGQRVVETLLEEHAQRGGVSVVTSHQPFVRVTPTMEVSLA